MTRELKALISLHDVMPETFSEVKSVIERAKAFDIPPIILLVVPGKDWQEDQLEQLKQWSSEGFQLAAHGWFHNVEQFGGLYHRLHATLISRRVAEHLSLSRQEEIDLIKRSVNWFVTQGFPHPDLYVPPAWALGKIRRSDMAELPVSYIEGLRGIYHTQSGKLKPLPLVGYEVDTLPRQLFVRPWNRMQIRRAERNGIPLRISLHPFDFSLRLASDLEQLLSASNLTPVGIEATLSGA